MRISDWSSDVCSSDRLGAPVAVGCPVSRRLVHAISLGPRLVDGQNAKAAASATADRQLREPVVTGAHPAEVIEPTGMATIGRASCRDRVCQYWWLAGVAGQLHKKNNNNKRESCY